MKCPDTINGKHMYFDVEIFGTVTRVSLQTPQIKMMNVVANSNE